jgi:sirohydrochlorin ferrochelatase
MSASTVANLLVTHGSRDPRSHRAAHQLVEQVQQRIASPVGLAALELAPEPLHQQIVNFCDRIESWGCTALRIVPLFLLPGVHVMDDIPAEVKTAQQSLTMPLTIAPYLGCHPEMKTVVQDPGKVGEPSRDRILLAHGSRRPRGNASVEALARQIGARIAYWSISPTLEECLQDCLVSLQAGAVGASTIHPIQVMPYFLFTGGITDAIAEQVAALQSRYPTLDLRLTVPLGATPALADIVATLCAPKLTPQELTTHRT